jgi:hypothetical protein
LRDFHPAFCFTVNVRRSKIGDGISNANKEISNAAPVE